MKAGIALALFVVLGLSAFTATAVVLPPSCPGGFHEVSSHTCLSNDTHVAPSSGVRIPDAAKLDLDSRAGLRATLAFVGAALLVGVMWAFSTRRVDTAALR